MGSRATLAAILRLDRHASITGGADHARITSSPGDAPTGSGPTCTATDPLHAVLLPIAADGRVDLTDLPATLPKVMYIYIYIYIFQS